MKSLDVPSFMLQESEEAEGLFGESTGSSTGVVEMTGVLKKLGCRGAQGELASESSEVVCVCYRIKPLPEADIEGDLAPDPAPGTGAGTGAEPVLSGTESAGTELAAHGGSSASPTTPITPTTPYAHDQSGKLGVVSEDEGRRDIEGYVDWCERGVRSRFAGTLTAGTCGWHCVTVGV
jgi:hypothetical protein